MPKGTSEPQEVVWARLRGFPSWPALASTSRVPKRATIVTFLGTGDHASIDASSLEPFDLKARDTDARFELPKKPSLREKFKEAIEEATLILHPPHPPKPAPKGKGKAVATSAPAAPEEEKKIGGAAPAPARHNGRGSSVAAAAAASSSSSGGGGSSSSTQLPAVAKVKLASAQHKPPLTNPNAKLIEKCGFVECARLVSADLCARITTLPMDTAERISNAFQLTLGQPHLAEVQAEIGASKQVADAVEAAFGVRAFEVKTVKVLMTEFSAQPQIPHADDYCNRELFGIVHLRAAQARTECVPYNASAPYPTSISVECDKCGAWVPLPDRIGRRRAHVNAPFCCADAGRKCVSLSERGATAKQRQQQQRKSAAQSETGSDAEEGSGSDAPTATAANDDRVGIVIPATAATDPLWAVHMQAMQQHANKSNGKSKEAAAAAAAKAAATSDPFACDVQSSFADLLYAPKKVIDDMRPMGRTPKAGDGVVALPTLVHRGPGGNDEEGSERWVLFFTIAPIFEGDAKAVDYDGYDFDETLGEYDPEAQIHAGWLLWRAGAVVPDPISVIGAYGALGFDLSSFGHGEKTYYGEDEERDGGGRAGGGKKKRKGGRGGDGSAKKKAKAGGGRGSSHSATGTSVPEGDGGVDLQEQQNDGWRGWFGFGGQ